MSTSRRAVIAGLAVAVMGGTSTTVRATVSDPVVALLARHDEAAAIFNAIPGDDEAADAAYIATWTALEDAPVATSREGAAAALNAILGDGSHIDPVHEALIRSALSFLQSVGGAA